MSNNWVVAGALTASGRPMLANDPHLSCTDPPFFYIMDLDSSGTRADGAPYIKAAGLSLPGTPGIAMGHNDRVAWGQTQLGYDVTDVYEETLVLDTTGTYPEYVIFKGSPVKLLTKDVVYYRDRTHTTISRTKTMYIVPHHGPLLDDTIDLGTKKAYSLKWTGQSPTDDFAAFMNLHAATNVDEALAAIGKYDAGGYSWVLADVEGNIAYTSHTKVPQRPFATKYKTAEQASYKPYLVLPGTGEAEWTGMISDAAIPWSKNPANNYFATANNDIVGSLVDNDPTNDTNYLTFDRDIGYRAMRIEKLIKEYSTGGNLIDFAAMARIQADNYSGIGFDLLPYFIAAVRKPGTLTATENQAISYLETWDYLTPTGIKSEFDTAEPTDAQKQSSIATSIFHAFLNAVILNTFKDELGDKLPGLSGESGPQLESLDLLSMLTTPTSTLAGFWDNVATTEVETSDAIIQKSFTDALAVLTEKLGSDPTAWNWGKLHTITFALAAEGITVPSSISPSSGPFPNDGALFTVDVANYGTVENKFEQNHCPQARIVYEMTDVVQGRVALSVGQSMDPASPYYNNMNKYWLTNTYVPLIFDPADLAGKIDTRVVMHP